MKYHSKKRVTIKATELFFSWLKIMRAWEKQGNKLEDCTEFYLRNARLYNKTTALRVSGSGEKLKLYGAYQSVFIKCKSSFVCKVVTKCRPSKRYRKQRTLTPKAQRV